MVVGYVESKDDAKAAALIAKADDVEALADYKGYKRWSSGEDAFVAVGENAVLFGTTEAALQQAIDTRGGAGQPLADSASFKDTLKQLPEDNLARRLRRRPEARAARDARRVGRAAARRRGRRRPRCSSSSPRRWTACAC